MNVWLVVIAILIVYATGFVLGLSWGYERGKADGVIEGVAEGKRAWDALRGAGPLDEP